MENDQYSGIENPDQKDRAMLERCIAALLEKDRLHHLGGFIQGLIHNINGPLQNMSMLVEVLLRGQGLLDAYGRSNPMLQTQEWGALVQKQGKRLHQLSQQITALADMLRSFMVLHEIEKNETEVDLNLVLTKLADAFRADLFYKHQVSLELRLTKNLPLIRVLGRHLIPALVHIFKNAITAMREVSEKRLTIESRVEDGRVRVLLRDTGCGLPHREAGERCFDLFYSAWPPSDASVSVEESHLGFGLYAARRLLEPYGIHVHLERANAETSVTVDIPIPLYVVPKAM